MSTPKIAQFSAERLRLYLADFVTLLQETINGGAALGFLPPLNAAEAERYWQQLEPKVARAEVLLFCTLDGHKVVATVQLQPSARANARHRAEVAKLMVAPSHRRQKIAERLMLHLEQVAMRRNWTTLTLDTREGDPSNLLYRSLGYTLVGQIPRYALSTPEKFHTTAFYYKLLDG